MKKSGNAYKHIFHSARELLSEIPKQEFHIHTTYSDGKNTVEDFAKKAFNDGFKSICFTEHVDYTTRWFYKYKKNIEINNKFYKNLKIYYGVEVRAKDYKGELNAEKQILKDSEIVMGVVHRIPSEDGLNVQDPKNFSSEELLELEYAVTVGLLEKSPIHILGHPMSNYEKIYGEVPKDIYIELLELAKKNKIAIELNPVYVRNFWKFLEINFELNNLTSMGSNAHSLNDFGLAYKEVRRLLE